MSRGTDLVVGFDPLWRKAPSLFGAALLSRLTAAFPATTPRWIAVTENIETIFDCSNQDAVDEYLRTRIARLTLDFRCTPQLLAGFLAFAAGVAAAPTGSTVNEIQTVTIDATAGAFTLTITVDGISATTVPIAWNASAATVAAALDDAINRAGYTGTGNAGVVKAGAVWTVTFGGRLAATDMTQMTADATNGGSGGLTGGAASVTVATTTPGSQKQHAISRMTGYQPPTLSVVVGFKDDPTTGVIFNCAVNSVRARFDIAGQVNCTVELIGRADLQPATGYTFPACATQDVIRPTDCRLLVDGVNRAGLREGEFSFANNLLVSDDAWTTASPDIDRAERADQRPQTLTFTVLGTPTPNDTLWAAAVARANHNVTLRLGTPGNAVVVNAPKATLRRNGDGVGLTGEARRSTLTLGADPKLDETSPANTPVNFVAFVPLSATYTAA